MNIMILITIILYGYSWSTILKAQADAQLAQTNANHANLIAFQTVTAQALAAKGGDKESKLTAAKKRILQACAGVMHADEFTAEQVYLDMDAEGGASEALGRILRKRLKPVPLSPYKTNIHITPQLIAMVAALAATASEKTIIIPPYPMPGGIRANAKLISQHALNALTMIEALYSPPVLRNGIMCTITLSKMSQTMHTTRPQWSIQRQVKPSQATNNSCTIQPWRRYGKQRLVETLGVWHKAMTKQVRKGLTLFLS